MRENKTTVKRQSLIKRFRFASSGVIHALQSEPSFRLQCLAALGVLILLVVLQPEPVWWAILLLTTGAVLAAELLNTALELVLDTIHPEKNQKIGQAKDCAAGAVFILSLISVGVFTAFLIYFFTQ